MLFKFSSSMTQIIIRFRSTSRMFLASVLPIVFSLNTTVFSLKLKV